MLELTSHTRNVLAFIWTIFKARREQGTPMHQAVKFSGDIFESDAKLYEWHNLDIEYALEELEDKEIIKRDVLGNFTLLNEGIVMLETNLLKIGKEVLGLAVKAVTIISPLK